MTYWWLLLIPILLLYVAGFVTALAINAQLPVTRGLAFLRAFMWPIWITTGWPSGRPLPMD